jgi:hypothetical protein
MAPVLDIAVRNIKESREHVAKRGRAEGDESGGSSVETVIR